MHSTLICRSGRACLCRVSQMERVESLQSRDVADAKEIQMKIIKCSHCYLTSSTKRSRQLTISYPPLSRTAALGFGCILTFFGFFNQCLCPLPCGRILMDVSSVLVQICSALVSASYLHSTKHAKQQLAATCKSFAVCVSNCPRFPSISNYVTSHTCLPTFHDTCIFKQKVWPMIRSNICDKSECLISVIVRKYRQVTCLAILLHSPPKY